MSKETMVGRSQVGFNGCADLLAGWLGGNMAFVSVMLQSGCWILPIVLSGADPVLALSPQYITNNPGKTIPTNICTNLLKLWPEERTVID